MSRYRPPAPPMAPYITPEGDKALRDELHFLWKVERPRITQSVSEAAAQGDRSENAEYTYGKKRLREIDSRVRYLRKRLDKLKVVREPPADQTRVYFGAKVELLDERGQTLNYRIVGPDEIDPRKSHISIDSIVARALLGKPVHAEVVIQTPSGTHVYEIMAVSYPSLPGSD